MKNSDLLNSIAIAALVVALTGCSSNPVASVASSAVKAITGSSGGPSLDVSNEVEKTKGNKHEQNEIKIAQTETTQTATTIINKQEIPIEFILLMCLGWLLPSPYELWKGFLNLFRLRKK